VLLPPINGATAASGTPYFTENPGDPFKAWDASETPAPRACRKYSRPSARGGHDVGVTPPGPEKYGTLPGFAPDLNKIEKRIDLAILVTF
jgi:hypothetical protein